MTKILNITCDYSTLTLQKIQFQAQAKKNENNAVILHEI
jgi:hypothetical protein